MIMGLDGKGCQGTIEAMEAAILVAEVNRLEDSFQALQGISV